MVNSLSRNTKLYLGVAILFLLLGAGNIFFGFTKTKEYTVILSSATDNLKLEINQQPLQPVPILGRRVDLNSQSEYLNKLRARINYYQMVEIGGKVFLAVAGILLMAALISIDRNPEENGNRIRDQKI